MRTLWVSALVLAVSLAGCSDGSQTTNEDELNIDTKATSTTGVIRGVVFDAAVVPIEGATVSIKAAGKDTITNGEGAFAFEQLEPGAYFLEVSKVGYEPIQVGTTVEAGIDRPPIVKVQLVANPSLVPNVVPLRFEGFIECSTGVGLPNGGYAYYSACSESSDLFPDDEFAVTYELGTVYPEWVQAEMVWKSTQTVSDHLGHNFYYPDPSELDGNMDKTENGQSPIINSMDNGTAKQYMEGLDYTAGDDLRLRMRVFTRAPDGVGLALTVKQDFEVFTHLFYNWAPDEDWLFIEDGEPVPPS